MRVRSRPVGGPFIVAPPDVEQVVVWRATVSDAAVAAARSLLTADDLARGRRSLPSVQRSGLVARAALRSVLGQYLHRTPRSLRFGRGPNGKPMLAGPATALRFSVAHAGDRCVVAVTQHREVGVDIERSRSYMPDVEALAHHWLAPEEASAILRHDERRRPEAFLRCWTRKEACVKASGTGLVSGIGAFVVTADERPHVLHAGDGEVYALEDLEVGPGYVGSVAVRGRGPSCRVSEYDLHWPLFTSGT
jgi:4'-phosphopantetheinyl transferase